MPFNSFSKKQLKVFSWWLDQDSEHNHAIICDGAVRSGKTVCLSLSFVLWSFARFKDLDFGLCGKTIRSLGRNLVTPLRKNLEELGFCTNFVLSRNLLEISFRGITNRYHLFGGKDEGSASLIQGMTLGGVLFDEVALMPRSFVEQALARCSVEGAKFWFNCNPEHPSHWFYKNWIKQLSEKNAFYIHFTMKDNPSLSASVIQRYENLYSGVFYQRYVEGKWVSGHGAIYPMFSVDKHVVKTLPEKLDRYIVSCDYGTTNPASFGLWGYCGQSNCWYRLKEYYHNSRKTGVVNTDQQYVKELYRLIGDRKVETIVIDPSAASFIAAIRRDGRYSVTLGENSIVSGIQLVTAMLVNEQLKISENCEDCIDEFSLYRWAENKGKDFPLQQDDHAMDDVRYFAMYAFGQKERGFYAVSAQRKEIYNRKK